MVSPPGAGGSRYAGRVVDPDVREDGETEPEVELNPSPSQPALPDSQPVAAESVSDPPAASEPEAEPEAAGRGASVRERLLAKARAAEEARADEPSALDSELEAIGRSAASPTDDAEDFTLPPLSGRAPSAPLSLSAPRELSPSVVAMFSALVGMAAIASLTALFMSLSSRLPASGSALTATTDSKGPTPDARPAPDPSAKPKRQRTKIPGPWRLADAKGDARYRFIEGKVGTDSFLKAFEAAGAPEAQGYRVLAAMRGVLDLDKHGKSDRFSALLERGTSKLFALEYLAGPEDVYQAKENGGRLTGSKLDLKIERAQIVGALSYDGSSFDKSAEIAGFDPGLSKVVARALDGHMALDELERGDVLRLVAQEVTVLGEFSRYAGIEALELLRADPQKSKLRIYYSDAPGVRGYYDHDGRAPFEGGWRKPINDAPRTSPFNPHRMNPVLHRVMPHQGTDYGSPVGTAIGAASFGTVSFVGPAGAAGNVVKILHPGGVETGYAHLSRFADGLKVGDRVKSMQVIGYVGNTGRSTGPHLHFSASRDGVFFDAETLNLDGMRNLSPAEREAFRPLMAKYDPLLDSIPMPERYQPTPLAKPDAATAAPSGAAATPGHEEDAQGDVDDEAASAASAPAPAPAAEAPAAGAKPGGSSVYLSDKELRDAQSATDDGEVDE